MNETVDFADNDKVSSIAKSLLASSFVEISINVVAKHERNWILLIMTRYPVLLSHC